ncbi:amidohydrolase [Caproicibacter fermentans]|uniref:Amidohydrolase n=1 Tax=Caproicibacter fermentans TaxID=2576756 RepID=A0A7G8TEI7_9FIRM|nr:amidohydrolase [Caproicibacter fermentans]QNK42028.1 amidohydrolase [Caproicibacter fermentans]
MPIKELAEKYESYVIEKRRYFHQHPELSWEEENTTNTIEAELKDMGIETKRYSKTGVTGMIHGGKPGKTVALRADIDALPIQENAEVPFRSLNPGKMHACGHDCHISMLLGAAKILTEIRDELEGDVKLIFQPAEEAGNGAEYMVKEGVMDGVDAVMGMHIFAVMRGPKINVQEGSRMAAAASFKIIVKGAAAHGSTPHLGTDAIAAASSIVMNLQSYVSRMNDPLSPLVVTVGTIHGGDRFNIIPQRVEMEGTLRTFSRKTADDAQDVLRRIAQQTASVFGATAELEYAKFTDPVSNDDALLNRVAHDAAVGLYGEDGIIPVEKLTGSEDFCYYMEKAPGYFAFLGAGNPDIGAVYSNHSDKFKVDEAALRHGSAFYARFACDYLKAVK